MVTVYGNIAGIDVHKKWLYVVIAPEEAVESEYERLRVGSSSRELERLADRLQAAGVRSVVMESTANYWRPVWAALEGRFQLYLAQAQSNAAPHGRKTDFRDATRLAKRLAVGELRLSYVPGAEQRGWRLLARTRVQYQREMGQVRSRLEGVLEEGRIKISGLLSDLLGASGRRMLRALAKGETDAQRLASLGDKQLKASPADLCDALQGQLTTAQRLLIGQALERIEALERQVRELDDCLAEAQRAQEDAIRRLCAIPGVSVTAARAIIAELGPTAERFASAAQVTSWVGTCPGCEQSAGKTYNTASAKGNWAMRRMLNQCAWAAVRTRGSYWEQLFKQLVRRLGPKKAIWAIANRLLRVIWIILHRGVEYQERGVMAKIAEQLKRRLERTARELRKHGIAVQVTIAGTGTTLADSGTS
jgi:transposase